MKFYIYKIKARNQRNFKFRWSNERGAAMSKIATHENCEIKDIDLYETSQETFDRITDLKSYNYFIQAKEKNFSLKLVNRKAVKVIEYRGSDALVEYVKNGKQCLVNRNFIKTIKK